MAETRNMYIGINGQPGPVNITSKNLSRFFTIENGTYYFELTENNTLVSNNVGIFTSTAQTDFIAKINLIFNFSFTTDTQLGDKFSIRLDGVDVVSNISGESSNTQSISMSSGQRLSFIYNKDDDDDSEASPADTCTILSMVVTPTSNYEAAREMKNAYIGVDNVARKIKSAYIGDPNGVARLCWHIDPITKLNNMTISPNSWMCTTPLNENAYFVQSPSNIINPKIGKINPSFTITSSSFSHSETNQLSTAVGNYIIFGGGYPSGSSGIATLSKNVYAFNSSLTKTSITALTSGRYDFTLITFNGHAIFAGGVGTSTANTTDPNTTLELYNSSLTKTINSTGYPARDGGGGVLDDYAIFIGGRMRYSEDGSNYIGPYKRAYAFDKNFTRTTLTDLNEKRADHIVVNIGKEYVIAHGGSQDPYSDIEGFDKSLTKHSVWTQFASRERHSGVSLQNYAIIMGGLYTQSDISKIVFSINGALTSENIGIQTSPDGTSYYESIPGTSLNKTYALFPLGSIIGIYQENY